MPANVLVPVILLLLGAILLAAGFVAGAAVVGRFQRRHSTDRLAVVGARLRAHATSLSSAHARLHAIATKLLATVGGGPRAADLGRLRAPLIERPLDIEHEQPDSKPSRNRRSFWPDFGVYADVQDSAGLGELDTGLMALDDVDDRLRRLEADLQRVADIAARPGAAQVSAPLPPLTAPGRSPQAHTSSAVADPRSGANPTERTTQPTGRGPSTESASRAYTAASMPKSESVEMGVKRVVVGLYNRALDDASAADQFREAHQPLRIGAANAVERRRDPTLAAEFSEANDGDLFAVEIPKTNRYFVVPRLGLVIEAVTYGAGALGSVFARTKGHDPTLHYTRYRVEEPAIFSRDGNRWTLYKEGSLGLGQGT